jgi:hypothetical protein
VGDSPHERDEEEMKNQPVKGISLCKSRGSYTLARVLQQELVGSDDSSIPKKIAMFLFFSLL